MKLEIFDVGHGACALLTTDNDRRMMIDCGHNADTGWLPGLHIWGKGKRDLDMLAVTNFDEDHASGANDLFDTIRVHWTLVNRSVPPSIITKLKTKDGMGPGIERIARELGSRTSNPSADNPEPLFLGVQRQAFCCDYPTFTDENNLSLAVFLKCHGVGFMFPGDLEEPAFAELLKRPAFCQALRETNVYVAAHHGRESGCSESIVPYLTNVFYTVISDKVHMHDTQKTNSFYRRIAKGGGFRGETRYVLTTRSDGTITFTVEP